MLEVEFAKPTHKEWTYKEITEKTIWKLTELTWEQLIETMHKLHEHESMLKSWSIIHTSNYKSKRN